jgi:hypothetical protein
MVVGSKGRWIRAAGLNSLLGFGRIAGQSLAPNIIRRAATVKAPSAAVIRWV